VRWALPESAPDAIAVTEAVLALNEAPPSPIHRDLKPDHIFLSNDRVTFIDLDSAAAGDPVRDPAHLYAHLLCRVGMDSLPRLSARIAADAFADEYFACVPPEWRATFRVHCAGALLEVAGGTFKRQEPRWREKATYAVAEAKAALSLPSGSAPC
jgi:aminoglycoside phosphotransferase (APT) family kinase protein